MLSQAQLTVSWATVPTTQVGGLAGHLGLVLLELGGRGVPPPGDGVVQDMTNTSMMFLNLGRSCGWATEVLGGLVGPGAPGLADERVIVVQVGLTGPPLGVEGVACQVSRGRGRGGEGQFSSGFDVSDAINCSLHCFVMTSICHKFIRFHGP